MDKGPHPETVDPMAGSTSFRSDLRVLKRVGRFVAGVSLGRLLASLAVLLVALDGKVSVLLLGVLVADLVQLSVRRDRWIFRAPLYVGFGLFAATAAVAAVVKLKSVESVALAWGAGLRRAADGLRRPS